MNDNYQSILQIFPYDMREQWKFLLEMNGKLQEIRLRAQKEICIWCDEKEYYLTKEGNLTSNRKEAAEITKDELERVVQHICKYSPYAYEHEMKQGYITIEGGHRIGLVGQAIVEKNNIRNLKHISGLNIRVAREVLGAADKVLAHLYQEGELYNTCIISPPCAGKTTMLRDMIRQVSNGNQYGRGKNVSVVDERSELAGAYLGIAQNDLGMRTDVLDGAPKVEGMMQLIRVMSPEVLAIDEIGTVEDVSALWKVMQCGCKVLTTIHGSTIDELQKKTILQDVIQGCGIQRYIVLGKRTHPGEVVGIYNEEFVHV